MLFTLMGVHLVIARSKFVIDEVICRLTDVVKDGWTLGSADIVLF